MAYVNVTLRVPSPVAVQVRELAKALGWQLADFLRTLTCLGCTFLLLAHIDEAKRDAATALMAGMKPLRPSRSFSLNPRPHRRPYAFRHGFRRSTLITLSLPESFRDLMAAYAASAHVSRNEMYNKSLQQGLLIYLKTQADLLATSKNAKLGEGKLGASLAISRDEKGTYRQSHTNGQSEQPNQCKSDIDRNILQGN